jgi:pilus assembly protein Flp/PilA
MPTSFLSLVKRFAREERGASMIEYGLLVGLITAGLVGVIATIGTDILAAFQTVSTAIATP